jgi:alpha-beta hydrolase superfamily lysophospholipase
MGGAVAILLSIELKSCISGMLLVAPMVKLDLPEWQQWGALQKSPHSLQYLGVIQTTNKPCRVSV